MTPVLLRGCTNWDRALLPPDEYEERVRLVQDNMCAQGMSALILFSNTFQPSSDFAWLGGWGVGGALVLAQSGEPKIFTFGGGREVFFQKAQAWLSHMSSVGANYGPALKTKLEEMGAGSGAIGIVGLSEMPATGAAGFRAAFAGRELRHCDTEIRKLRRVKRVRERLVMRQALTIAEAASAEASRAYAAGASVTKAMTEAERVARMMGALDYRCLANIVEGDLRPFEENSAHRGKKLMLWGAVNYHGYWAETALDADGGGLAQKSLDAMIRALKPGVRMSDVAKAGLAALPKSAAETAISFTMGGSTGQSLDEDLPVTLDNSDTVPEGAILSLRIFAKEPSLASLAGAMVEVAPNGAARFTSH